MHQGAQVSYGVFNRSNLVGQEGECVFTVKTAGLRSYDLAEISTTANRHVITKHVVEPHNFVMRVFPLFVVKWLVWVASDLSGTLKDVLELQPGLLICSRLIY